MFLKAACSMIVLSQLAGCQPENSDHSPKSSAHDAATEQPTSALSPANERQIELLIKDKHFERDRPDGPLLVSFDDLDLHKIFGIDLIPVNITDHFPDWLKGLNGKTIRIRGFMLPTYETAGLEQFALENGPRLNNFGAPYKVHELIAVELKPGTTCDYIHLREFDVIGKFRIEMQAEDGKPFALYGIEDAEVILPPKRGE